ncbi:MAG: glycosyltransferase family 39 protein, partial [Chloroflexota bacterium]
MSQRQPAIVTAALWVCALMLVAFGLYHAYLTLTGLRPYDQPLFDEPLFAEMSRVAADGGLLYTDQWDHKPPVLFWIMAVFIRVMGAQILTIKVATIAVNLAFVGVIAALSGALSGRRSAAWIGGLLAFAYAMWQGYLEGYNSVFIMSTFSAGAMLAAVVARGRAPLLLLSGVLLAGAFFTKQVMVFEAFATLGFAALYAPAGRRWEAALGVVFGGLLGVAWVAAYTALRGNLVDLWYGSFYTGLLYSFEGGSWHFNEEFSGFFQLYFVGQTLPFIGLLLGWGLLAALMLLIYPGN